MNDWIKVILTRDSVAAGDDVDAPHEKIFKLYPDESLEVLAEKIKSTGYLPSIQGGKATWFMYVGSEPICLLTMQDKESRFLDGRNYRIEVKATGGSLEVQVKYFAQQDPDFVFNKIAGGVLPNSWNRFA